MNEDMHQMSSSFINSVFDGFSNLQKQTQDGYNATINAFNSTTNAFNQNEPRRTDGFFQQPQNQYGGGYGQPNGMQQQVPPPSYGYGYNENNYPCGNNGNNSGQVQAYYGFYNPAYGK